MDLKELVYKDLKNIEELKDVDNLLNLLTISNDVKTGDVSFPCFSLAKIFKSAIIKLTGKPV